MAIKGKTKAKGRPKPVARAPRREPVPVKPPMARRRWVQLTAAAIVGAFAVVMLVWVTNGLRKDSADARAADEAASRRTAATKWQSEVESAFGSIATANQGAAPTVLTDMSTALDSMNKTGVVPKGAVKTFASAASDAQTTIHALTTFDIAGAIRSQGFDAAQALSYTDSRERLIAVAQQFQRAAQVAGEAAAAPAAQRRTLTKIAVDLRDSAQAELTQAWALYQQALASGGVIQPVPAPTGSGTGLGG